MWMCYPCIIFSIGTHTVLCSLDRKVFNVLKDTKPDLSTQHNARKQANTKLTTRKWKTAAAAHCGEVGIVQKLYRKYPNKNCGYVVKFEDGDKKVRLNTFTEKTSPLPWYERVSTWTNKLRCNVLKLDLLTQEYVHANVRLDEPETVLSASRFDSKHVLPCSLLCAPLPRSLIVMVIAIFDDRNRYYHIWKRYTETGASPTT